MNTQDQSAPNSPSRHEGNSVDSPRLRWMNAATSGLILVGLVAFFGLVAALFYLALEDLADENIPSGTRPFVTYSRRSCIVGSPRFPSI